MIFAKASMLPCLLIQISQKMQKSGLLTLQLAACLNQSTRSSDRENEVGILLKNF